VTKLVIDRLLTEVAPLVASIGRESRSEQETPTRKGCLQVQTRAGFFEAKAEAAEPPPKSHQPGGGLAGGSGGSTRGGAREPSPLGQGGEKSDSTMGGR